MNSLIKCILVNISLRNK